MLSNTERCNNNASLDYFQGSMFEALKKTCAAYPNMTALNFIKHRVSFEKLERKIIMCAKSLKAIGVKKGQAVTIALPNCPQAVYMFYAVNAIGAISNMVHPLSSEDELKFYINEAKSPTIIVLDRFYNKVKAIKGDTNLNNIIVTKIEDELSIPFRTAIAFSETFKNDKILYDKTTIKWKSFLNLGKGYKKEHEVHGQADDTAVILYSGGTTGIPKGICLTNLNFNALSQQLLFAISSQKPTAGDRMLSVMPMFHGFGLGICIHLALLRGGDCILMPRFNGKQYGKMVTKYKCNFIAGVPTLFEALINMPSMQNADLSFLKGVFCGGDSLSNELKVKIDKFLIEHNSSIHVQEGYGITETVTACCLSPLNDSRPGSFGLPFPDTFVKIVKQNTDIELPLGEVGEILLSGPTVMKKYLNCPKETKNTLRVHSDGRTWVYTGDLGVMDSDGFTYFKGRTKRMIVSSGYNIYPEQLENTLSNCEYVKSCCIIGVPDKHKMQCVKAFIVPAEGVAKNDKTREKILEYCKKHIIKYSIPKEIEFLDELPKTSVGKTDYHLLEKNEGNASHGVRN